MSTMITTERSHSDHHRENVLVTTLINISSALVRVVGAVVSTPAEHICTVPATELALKHVGRPLPNAALLGGFAALSDRISLESVNAAIREKFPARIAEGNVAAATEAHEYVMQEMRESTSAETD